MLSNEPSAPKISDESIVRHLLFVFFKHRDDYQLITKPGEHRDNAKEELNIILNTIFAAIQNRNFDRVNYNWISDDIINENFNGRKFNIYYKWIRAEKTNYIAPKAGKFRISMAAIAAVSRDIFRGNKEETSKEPYSYITDIRSNLNITESKEGNTDQLRVLGQIENALRAIESRPTGAISFDDQNQPVIKTRRAAFFPINTDHDERIVVGRYVVYRRAFQVMDKDREYIREYILIDRKRHGLIFRWETRVGQLDQPSEIHGVGLFTHQALWLVGHCSLPVARMRVLAANVPEWQKHKLDKMPFCTAIVLSHKGVGDHNPVARSVILRRDKKEFWDNEEFDKRCRFMSLSEIQEKLSNEEVRIISACRHEATKAVTVSRSEAPS